MSEVVGREQKRRCCVCGEWIGDGDAVLPGIGGERGRDLVLYVHLEDCADELLRYLRERSARLEDA
jgi:hypothetical protein